LNKWQWALQLVTRRMWFRAALFCLFAIMLALASPVIGRAIPYEFAARIGAQSVDNILNVLASSMLAVTTFSLTAMVSAYSGATSNITPRAVQLLVEDSTAQNALATFLGSFLFAIVGIIALSTGFYGDSGRVILFGGTILVIANIVITFLRWIEHITRFGRVNDTIDRVENAALKAARTIGCPPQFGPRSTFAVPAEAERIHLERIGRVTHVDVKALRAVAEDLGAEIVLKALPGAMTGPSRVAAWTRAALNPGQEERVKAAFTTAHDRAFDYDPRFGLVVLSEIASRALSPAVNDPGTAISVLESATRVLAAIVALDPSEDGASKDSEKGTVTVPPLHFVDLLEDVFRPIARDGAGVIEVAIRLQKSLAALADTAPAALADCSAAAGDALARALDSMRSESDRSAIAEVHRRYWA